MIFSLLGGILLIILIIVVLIITTIFVLYKYSFKVETLYYSYINKQIYKTNNYSQNGIKIVYFSDLHLGRLQKKESLKMIINQLVQIDADIYLFGGDLIGDNIKKYYSLESLKEIFEPLKNKMIIAVYGNHEFKSYDKNLSKEDIEKYYDACNFKVLEDELYSYKGINIYGLKDGIYHELRYNKIDNGIVLIHEGDFFDEINGSYLMLSGHTHGGQIKLPIYYRPSHGKKYTSGFYNKNRKSLIVSKGLGCNLLRMRFNAKCDIIIINYIKEEK